MGPLLVPSIVIILEEGVLLIGADGSYVTRASRHTWGVGGLGRDHSGIRGLVHAPESLGQTLLALQASSAGTSSTVLVPASTALNVCPASGGTIQKCASSQTHALRSMNRFDASGGIKVRSVALVVTRVNGGAGRIVIVAFVHGSVEQVQINVGIVWPCTSKGHIGRVLGECLHGCSAQALAVTVRIAGIERPIVMEHYTTTVSKHLRQVAMGSNSLPVP